MLWLPKLFGKKYVATIHGLDHQRAKWGKFASNYILFGEKCAVKYADEIIVLSDVVHLNNFNYQLTPKKDYILYFGRFSKEKGIGTLIDVCKPLPNIQFIFAGTGSLENSIDNIPNIKNVGFQKGTDLENLIREAKLSIYPSEWYENCPFSVMESQMYGTPVLGANIGDIPELIEVGKTGELFESGSPKELKQKIENLWNSPNKLAEYSDNCKNISFYNISQYYNKLIKIYQ